MNSIRTIATICALGLSQASMLNIEETSLSEIQAHIKMQNEQNERVYRQRLDEVQQQPIPYGKDFVQLRTSQDDFDDNEIAAYSVDMSSTASEYQTLGEKQVEKASKAQQLKTELVEKKKKLKKMEAQKKKEEKARKAELAKKKKAQKKVESIDLGNDSFPSQKKEEAPFPQDEAAMKAYSLAVAHSAEANEPELPTGFGTLSEKSDTSGPEDSNDADKSLSSLFSHNQRGHMSGSSFGIELIQLNAEGMNAVKDEDESPASDDTTAVQTEETQQNVEATTEEAPAEEAPAAEEAVATTETTTQAADETTAEAPAAEAPAEAPAAEAPAADSAVVTTAEESKALEQAAENADTSSVQGAKLKFAKLQQDMEDNLKKVEDTRAQQEKDFKMQNSDDPAGQLKGLMNARDSLHRMSMFAAKPKQDKVKDMAKALDIEFTPELMKLGSNENISNALVEIAVQNGKTEEEIAAALG